jgi:predicted dehydrogenase
VSDELRIAVIGAGDVAARDYLPEMHRLAGKARVDLLASRTGQRTRDIAEKFGIPRWTLSWRDALADDIDVIVNLTPAPLHDEINLAAVTAGKHLYTEKPSVIGVEAGRRLQAAATRSGSVVVAAPSLVLFPQVRRAAEVLASNAIGPVHSARAFCSAGLGPWEGYEGDHTPFWSAEIGPLTDLGIYPLHAITGLLGPAIRVCAMSSTTRREFTVVDGPYAGQRVPVASPDNWQVILELATGALVSIQSAFCIAANAGPSLELNGEVGTIGLNLLDVAAPISVLAGSEGWVDEAVPHQRAEGPDHLLGVEHLVDCLATGERPQASLEHALHVLEILEAAARSARTGERIDIEQPTPDYLSVQGSRP